MPDRESPRNLRKHVFGKNVCDAAHGLVGSRRQSIRSHNPRRFLPPVLQRVQAEIREFLCFWMRKDRNHAALVFELVLCHLCSLCPRGFQAFQSAATNSGSVRSVASSASSYTALNSDTVADTTVFPSNEISRFSGIVSPITSAAMPCFSATSLIRSTFAGSQEIAIRLASSPNRVNSAGSPFDATFSRAPTPLGNAFSANVTANPPT